MDASERLLEKARDYEILAASYSERARSIPRIVGLRSASVARRWC
jgi:hypothetical protein